MNIDHKKHMPRFVLIDDDPLYRAMLLRSAQREGMSMDAYDSLMDLGFVGLLGRYDAAIVDYDLDNLSGVEIAEYLSALFGDIPMILVSAKERRPEGKVWPKSIKTFVKKSAGLEAALEEARKYAIPMNIVKEDVL